MLLLAIDTAGPNCAVALAKSAASGAEVLYAIEERIGRGHAERLIPMLEAALESAGLSYPDLDRIAVTTGPGSFTGVRIGVAAARGLALALGVPAVGISSLTALAFGVSHARNEGTVVAVLDGKRGELYAQAQDLATGSLVFDATAASAEHIAQKLAQAARPLVLTGAGAPLLAPYLSNDDVEHAGAAEAPDIADVSILGLRAEPGRPPVPLYARGADAKPQAAKAVARA